MLTIIEQLHALATVQTEKLGGQTAVLSEDATESSVMPVPDEHLWQVMPALKRALENGRPCHVRRSHFFASSGQVTSKNLCFPTDDDDSNCSLPDTAAPLQLLHECCCHKHHIVFALIHCYFFLQHLGRFSQECEAHGKHVHVFFPPLGTSVRILTDIKIARVRSLGVSTATLSSRTRRLFCIFSSAPGEVNTATIDVAIKILNWSTHIRTAICYPPANTRCAAIARPSRKSLNIGLAHGICEYVTAMVFACCCV